MLWGWHHGLLYSTGVCRVPVVEGCCPEAALIRGLARDGSPPDIRGRLTPFFGPRAAENPSRAFEEIIGSITVWGFVGIEGKSTSI